MMQVALLSLLYTVQADATCRCTTPSDPERDPCTTIGHDDDVLWCYVPWDSECSDAQTGLGGRWSELACANRPTGESGSGESGAGESGSGESGSGESGAGEAGAGESGAGESGSSEPGYAIRDYDCPGAQSAGKNTRPSTNHFSGPQQTCNSEQGMSMEWACLTSNTAQLVTNLGTTCSMPFSIGLYQDEKCHEERNYFSATLLSQQVLDECAGTSDAASCDFSQIPSGCEYFECEVLDGHLNDNAGCCASCDQCVKDHLTALCQSSGASEVIYSLFALIALALYQL